MKDAKIDNSASADLDVIVTWQYDDSASICAFIDFLKTVFDKTCGDNWNGLVNALKDKNALREFMLSILGRLIGVPRFDVTVGSTTSPVSIELYEKLIIGKFVLCFGGATTANYASFIKSAFGEGNVDVSTWNKMDLIFKWKDGVTPTTDEDIERKYVVDNWLERLIPYPVGVHDNDKSNSLRFWLAEETDDVPAEGVNGGGLDESSFDWK